MVKDLGAVSAYALAVEKGYSGTEEEFALEQVAFAENARIVQANREHVDGAVTEFNKILQQNIDSVRQTGTEESGKVRQEGSAQLKILQDETKQFTTDREQIQKNNEELKNKLGITSQNLFNYKSEPFKKNTFFQISVAIEKENYNVWKITNFKKNTPYFFKAYDNFGINSHIYYLKKDNSFESSGVTGKIGQFTIIDDSVIAILFQDNHYGNSDKYIKENFVSEIDQYAPFLEIPDKNVGFTKKQNEELDKKIGNLKNPLEGRKAVFDGDSICHGTSAKDGKNGWAGRIGVKNHMDWHNEGISGGTITSNLFGSNGEARHWISTNIDKIYDKYPDLDYLILEGGTNDADIIGTERIGNVTNSFDYNNFDNTADFTQALEYLFSKAISLYPEKKIGFIIAHKMTVNATPTSRANYKTGVKRKFFDRCVEVCKKYGVPCLDLWNIAHLNNEIDYISHGNKYYMYTDGQHLSTVGYDYVSDVIEAWMKTL